MNWFRWALLSGFFAGLTAVLAKIGVAGVDSTLATAIRTSVVLIFTLALFFTIQSGGNIFALTSRNWLFLVLSGLATGLSWVCYFRALQLGEASRVAPIDKLSVLFAIVFAVLFLKEHLTWQHWIGGSLVLIGSIILGLQSK